MKNIKKNEDLNKKKKLWLCDNCNSDNLQAKMWVNINNNKIIDGVESKEYWCEDCQGHWSINEKEMNVTDKVEGFQLVKIGNVDEMHPNMKNNLSLYSIDQLDEFNNDGDWKILTIWSGDIETPEIMYKGNVR